MELNKIHTGHVIDYLRSLPENSVNCIVTSPPYYGLRDYGMEAQIGLEETPEEFINVLTEVFIECLRVLKNDGTLWLNIGDSYWGGKGASGTQSPEKADERNKEGLSLTSKAQQLGGKGYTRPTDKKHDYIKPKDLIGIPWMLAFSLRSAGWYLRQDIIWHKPNPMPESVTDRCTKSHEYIFLLSKSASYYYDSDSIKQPLADSTINRVTQDLANQNGSDRVPGKTNGNMKAVVKGVTFGGKKGREYNPLPDDPNFRNGSEQWGREYTISEDGKANKRSVWTVTTKPFKEAHFATFPEDLIVDCIKAGCPENGIVLDPFMGAGTTALVARKLNRNFIGCELNPAYVKIANKRLKDQLGMFL